MYHANSHLCKHGAMHWSSLRLISNNFDGRGGMGSEPGGKRRPIIRPHTFDSTKRNKTAVWIHTLVKVVCTYCAVLWLNLWAIGMNTSAWNVYVQLEGRGFRVTKGICVMTLCIKIWPWFSQRKALAHTTWCFYWWIYATWSRQRLEYVKSVSRHAPKCGPLLLRKSFVWNFLWKTKSWQRMFRKPREYVAVNTCEFHSFVFDNLQKDLCLGIPKSKTTHISTRLTTNFCKFLNKCCRSKAHAFFFLSNRIPLDSTWVE